MKKVPSRLPSNPPQKIWVLSSPTPAPFLFENLVRGSKSRKEGTDYVEIPNLLFSHFIFHKIRYAHVLESLFKKISGVTVSVLLNTVFFSSYLTSLHKFKNLERTPFKICDSNPKFLRRKSPKYKAINLKL